MTGNLLTLGVGLIALIDAAFSIYRGANEMSAGLALGYAAFATVYCGGILLALRRARRQAPSPLVRGDTDNRAVNFAISVGMLVAFCLALILQRAEMVAAARLVDPDPRQSGRDPDTRRTDPHGRAGPAGAAQGRPGGGGRGLGRRTGARRARRPANAGALSPCRPARAHDLWHGARAPGRGRGWARHKRTDALRRAAVAAVAARHSPVIVDMAFTAIEEFAAPATGFVIDAVVDQACGSTES